MNGKLVELKLDTGAEINVKSNSIFSKLPNSEMVGSSVKLFDYSQNEIDIVGEAWIKCEFRGNTSLQKFAITKCNFVPVLSLSGCESLNLIRRVDCVEIAENEDDVLRLYKDNFTGVGCFVENFKLTLIDKAQSVAKPPRRVPTKLIQPLKKELDRLEAGGIILKADEPAEWISNLVIVEKSSGDLRLCMDPQDVNKNLKEESYMIPKFEDLSQQLVGKRYFSVLDIKEGFYQIGLDESSSRLCTFNTPFGCYRFLRMPFGIKVAPEAFQKYNEKNFSEVEGKIIYIDDILIHASSREEHDKIFAEIMKTARAKGVTFNPKKLQFRQQSVKFLGHVISSEGISFDEDRIKSIRSFPEPSNKKDI